MLLNKSRCRMKLETCYHNSLKFFTPSLRPMASGQVHDEPALKLITSARLLYISHSNAKGHDVLNHAGGMNKTPVIIIP